MASYLRPTTLNEALAALAAGPRTLLAGGTDHYPARATFEPDEDILDLTALPGLRRIERDGAYWRIPALATWTALIEADLPPLFDGLREAASQVGGWQVQNRGTIAGNVCNASPAADGIPALLALDAELELASVAGTRALPLERFLLGPRRTARRPDEVLVAIRVPDRQGRSVFEKLGARRYLVISISMVAVTLELDGSGLVVHARVAVGACGPVATRLQALEAALLGRRPDPALVRPEHLAPLSPIDDVRATAAYRMAATAEKLRRALERFG
ncbi:MAG TPA: FAD binding domain-containing protein [Acetobacteraceae bacterium]|nr:FAD binding domain-containing protein [Acetobacteraceae bacterium]